MTRRLAQKHVYKIEHREGYRYDEWIITHRYPNDPEFTEVRRFLTEEEAEITVQLLKVLDKYGKDLTPGNASSRRNQMLIRQKLLTRWKWAE